MTAHPSHSEFEARTNATYEALMWALSRPGLPRRLPASGLAGIAEALLDRECKVFCDEPILAQAIAQTGAAMVSSAAADHLFFDTLPGAQVLEQINFGSDLHPETGATLVCMATLGQGPRLRLEGPGCNGSVDLQLDGLPDGFWQTRARLMRYPMGFEVFCVDGARVVGVPRSCRVEVI